MYDTTALLKILDVRQQEKNEALVAHKIAIDQFEKVATQLYEQLKTKEHAQEVLNRYVQSEIIKKIREQTLYIDMLNQKINHLQREVQIARQNMEEKQQIVTEKHIEVKKIEKMIEKREQAKKVHEAREEMKHMDEISIQQYTRTK